MWSRNLENRESSPPTRDQANSRFRKKRRRSPTSRLFDRSTLGLFLCQVRRVPRTPGFPPRLDRGSGDVPWSGGPLVGSTKEPLRLKSQNLS